VVRGGDGQVPASIAIKITRIQGEAGRVGSAITIEAKPSLRGADQVAPITRSRAPITVVVEAVPTDLGNIGIGQVGAVIAVTADRDIFRSGGAGVVGGIFVTPAIFIEVRVPDRSVHRILICGTIAVVIDLVAEFVGTRKYERVAVITVATFRDGAFGCETILDHIRGIALSIGIIVKIPKRGILGTLIHGAIAVVITAVAKFSSPRVDHGL
jgi:hypothetical protein